MSAIALGRWLSIAILWASRFEARTHSGDFLDAGQALVRMTVMPDYRASPHPVLGWDVADISAAARALRSKGVDLTIYQGMGQDPNGVWTAPDGKTRVAWFVDPDGNVLSLSQSAQD